MKVLHIWNTAGVASTIAKYQAKLLGWDTWVMTRKVFDRYGLTTYGEALDCGAKIFSLKALIRARGYDVVHVHSLDKLVPWLKAIYPNKPVILHYHGSEIRGKWKERACYWRRADLVLVSTPDLLEGAPRGVTYLPNPVDLELFKPLPGLREEGTALYIIKHQEGEDLSWVRKVASKLKLKLTVRDRISDPIDYVDLPTYLNKFEYYIDRNYVRSLSKTALEALACGLKVVRWDEKVVEGLPDAHRPANVIKALAELYGNLKR